MRRRLLNSTLLIALLSAVVLGVPLAVLARAEVVSSAHDQLAQEAQIVAAQLEDRLDAGLPVTRERLRQIAPGRRILLMTATGTTVTSSPPIKGSIDQASVSVAGAHITVQQSQAISDNDARNVILLVLGLALIAFAAAVVLALRQARQLASPLTQLAERAAALGDGEFTLTRLTSDIPEIDAIFGVLERSARQLGAFVQMQRQFAADAAHQLRTPLTGVALRLEEMVYLGDEAIRAEVEAALAQVERLNTVITDLLNRARGDAAAPDDLDLSTLAAEECAPWQRVLDSRGRRLLLRAELPVYVHARQAHVTGVLAALIDNAVTHGAGTVTVTVTVDHDDRSARMAVTDEGVGVPAQLRDTVFTRSISSNHGTGIGLSLARSLSEAENGTLALDESGRTFTLQLPLRPPGTNSPSAVGSTPGHAGSA